MKTLKIIMYTQALWIMLTLILFLITVIDSYFVSMGSSYCFSNWKIDFIDRLRYIIILDVSVTVVIIFAGIFYNLKIR